jgi:hypothetical protein
MRLPPGEHAVRTHDTGLVTEIDVRPSVNRRAPPVPHDGRPTKMTQI